MSGESQKPVAGFMFLYGPVVSHKLGNKLGKINNMKNTYYKHLILVVATMSFMFSPFTALAYGEGGGIVPPWLLVPTPTPTPLPAPIKVTISESGKYYRFNGNVYETSSGRLLGLSEFQQLGLNFALLPIGTAPTTPSRVVARAPVPKVVARLIVTPTPKSSLQPNNSLESKLPLAADISQNLQTKTGKPGLLRRLFNWLLRRK